MKRYLVNLLRKENRTLLNIIIGFLILFLSAIIFPYYQRYIEQNWDNYLNSKIEKTIQKIQEFFNQQQEELFQYSNQITKEINLNFQNLTNSKPFSKQILFKYLSRLNNEFSFQLLNKNNETVVWSDYKLQENLFSPIDWENGFEIIKSNFKTYLTYSNKIEIKDTLLYLITIRELESNYYIKNEFIKNKSITDFISNEFGLKISIIWDTLYFSLKTDILERNPVTIKPIKFLDNRAAFYILIEKPDRDLYLSDLAYFNFGYFQKFCSC